MNDDARVCQGSKTGCWLDARGHITHGPKCFAFDDAKRLEEIENLAKEFHAVYQVEAKRQGSPRHPDAYDELPENIKEFDRVLARYAISRVIELRNERDQPLLDELERLRLGLQEIQNPGWGIGGGKAVHGNSELSGCEEFYKGYNAGIDTQFARTAKIAEETLAVAEMEKP